MRAEREERLQDQQLQHENSVVLQGCYDRHREDINNLFGRFRRVRDQGNNLDEVQRVANHWLGLVHDRLCKCPPNNTLPPITQRPFPIPPSDPIVASPTRSSSGQSYADVAIQGEDINVGVSMSGPSSDPGFVPFAPTVPSSSAPTTTEEAPRSQETPSSFTVQEEELIALEEEDRIMRENLECRMNAPGRTRPGGVCQG